MRGSTARAPLVAPFWWSTRPVRPSRTSHNQFQLAAFYQRAADSLPCIRRHSWPGAAVCLRRFDFRSHSTIPHHLDSKLYIIWWGLTDVVGPGAAVEPDCVSGRIWGYVHTHVQERDAGLHHPAIAERPFPA